MPVTSTVTKRDQQFYAEYEKYKPYLATKK